MLHVIEEHELLKKKAIFATEFALSIIHAHSYGARSSCTKGEKTKK